MVRQALYLNDVDSMTDTLTHLAGLLLDKEPTSMQAISLAELIETKVTQGTVPFNTNVQTLNTP